MCILRQVSDNFFPVMHLNMSHVNVIAVVLFCFSDSRDMVFWLCFLFLCCRQQWQRFYILILVLSSCHVLCLHISIASQPRQGSFIMSSTTSSSWQRSFIVSSPGVSRRCCEVWANTRTRACALSSHFLCHSDSFFLHTYYTFCRPVSVWSWVP